MADYARRTLYARRLTAAGHACGGSRSQIPGRNSKSARRRRPTRTCGAAVDGKNVAGTTWPIPGAIRISSGTGPPTCGPPPCPSSGSRHYAAVNRSPPRNLREVALAENNRGQAEGGREVKILDSCPVLLDQARNPAAHRSTKNQYEGIPPLLCPYVGPLQNLC
jgi:hypothetical protein